jgi:hypothetical protein
MLYEIINPSDPYTIEVEDFDVAAVACVMLGRGTYGFVPIDATGAERNAPSVPIFFFGSVGDWFHVTFGVSLSGLLDRVLAEKREALATALESVLIGEPAQRATFFATAPTDRAEFEIARAVWHEARRSSMNDIGARAWELACRVRKEAPATV